MSTGWSEYRAEREAAMTPRERELAEACRRKIRDDMARYERSRIYRLRCWWKWRDLHWHNFRASVRDRVTFRAGAQ